MSGVEMMNLRPQESNIEVYNSHEPENFNQALDEFNKFCHRQLPIRYTLSFIPTCFKITNNEENIVIGGSIGNIANFLIEKQQIIRDEELSHSHSIISIEVVLNDKQVIALNDNHELFFLEFPSFEVLYRTTLRNFPVIIKQNPKLNLLYVSNGAEELSCISLSDEEDFYTRKFKRKIMPINGSASCLQITDDGVLLAVGLETGEISLFYSNNEKLMKSTEPFGSKPTILVFGYRNTFIAAGFEDSSIRVWNMDNSLSLLRDLGVRHSDLVSGLAFVRENRYLVSSSHDGFIYVWDLKVESIPYTMNLNDIKIIGLELFKDHKSVAYCQDSDNLFIWPVPQLPRNARYRAKEKITKLLFLPDSFDLISLSEDGIVQLWDYRQDKALDSLQLEGALLSGMIIGTIAYIYSSKPCIYKLHTASLKYDVLELQAPIISFDISLDETLLATSYTQNTVKIHELKFPKNEPQRDARRIDMIDVGMVSQLKGHTLPVNKCSFVHGTSFLVSGSQDTTLIKWDVMKGKAESTFIGHSAAVTTFYVGQDDFLISADETGIINIWSIAGLLLYTMKSPDEAPTVDLYLSFSHSYLVTLQPGRVTYWQLMNLSILFQTDTNYEASCFALSSDEKIIALGEAETILVEENAVASEKLRIVGKNLGSPQKFMKFVVDCQSDSSKVLYDMNHNHWLVTPYLIGPAHVLAATNRFDDLSKALNHPTNSCGLFATANGENPLSICIDKEYKNCIDVCLKYMKTQSQGNDLRPKNNRAYYPLENCLSQLNRIEYPYIVKLYDFLFIESEEADLPRFCIHEAELPVLYFSDHLSLIPAELVPEENFTNTGRPIVFTYSTFPLDLDIGTDGSIDFMKSILECSHSEIFRSTLIQEYLNYKWSRVKKIIYIQNIIYIFYLILLGFHIVLYLEDRDFLYFLFIVHGYLWLFEVWQISSDFSEYWDSIWNVLDQLRGLSFNFYALIWLKNEYNYDILLAVVIFSWARGIACFRMFDASRAMVRLVIQVILDIRSFFMILFYSTLAFAFVFYMRDPHSQPFLMNLTRAYRLDLGDFETDLHSYFDWGIFFISTMINPLMMLNLLIAVMSDTATRSEEFDDINGLRELTEMILDVEKIMFWKKGISHKHYLQKCDFVCDEEGDVDKMANKLKIIKKKVISIEETARNIKENAERMNGSEIKNKIDSLREKQDAMKEEMRANFANGKELMAKIVNRLENLD